MIPTQAPARCAQCHSDEASSSIGLCEECAAVYERKIEKKYLQPAQRIEILEEQLAKLRKRVRALEGRQ
jgi:hypothetical protein